jgi:NSS family neurotransmitter:Na+ symporter
MALPTTADREHTWSSGLVFILAAIGAAVGLGNIWKFPYIVGVSGGGAFVLVYLICVVFVAVPILIGELLLGRRGHHSPPVAVSTVAVEAGRSPAWSLAGWLGVGAGFLIATYYSVIAGWTLAYIFKALDRFGGASPESVAAQFEALQAEPLTMVLWHTVFIVITMTIVARGLHDGIERTVSLLMPALFAMVLVMIGYAAVAGDMGAALDFLFSTDFGKIDGATVLTAIGQSFFSIGVAMGLMMAYGAYVPRHISLTKSALIIAVADTMVALLAGLMIFPLVFANNLDPGSGPGLIFRTLPTAFAGMPGGGIFGALFFLLLAFAAVTSLIAIIEPIVAYAEDKLNMSRRNGCLLFGGLAWAIGLGSVLSFNAWKGVAPLAMFERFGGMTFYDLVDYFTANVMMPLGGILIAMFVGWRLRPEMLADELSFGSPLLFRLWLWMIRIVAPVGIVGVMYSSL